MVATVLTKHDPELDALIDFAICNKLFPWGYEFERLFFHANEQIEIMSCNDYGCAVVWKNGEHEYIGCYIKPQYRRQGFGSKLIEDVGGVGERRWSPNAPGSEYFFTKDEK